MNAVKDAPLASGVVHDGPMGFSCKALFQVYPVYANGDFHVFAWVYDAFVFDVFVIEEVIQRLKNGRLA